MILVYFEIDISQAITLANVAYSNEGCAKIQILIHQDIPPTTFLIHEQFTYDSTGQRDF